MNDRELAHATGLEPVGENVHDWKMPNGKPLSEWIVLSRGPNMLGHCPMVRHWANAPRKRWKPSAN